MVFHLIRSCSSTRVQNMMQEGKQMLRRWVSISAATASLIRRAWPGLQLYQSFAGTWHWMPPLIRLSNIIGDTFYFTWPSLNSSLSPVEEEVLSSPHSSSDFSVRYVKLYSICYAYLAVEDSTKSLCKSTTKPLI